MEISEDKGSDDDFSFSYGKLYISVYAKGDVSLPEDYKERAIPFDDLPKILIKDFSRMTAGLVSNVAIGSISAIRKYTHLILGRLSPEMDPPYLAHRALLPCPDDAMLHVVDIVSSEFHSLLQNHDVGKNVDINMINAWAKMKENEGANFKIKMGSENVDITRDNLCDIEKNGFGESDWLKSYIDTKFSSSTPTAKEEKKQKFKRKAYKELTKTFCVNGENQNQVNCKFAILTSTKSHYPIKLYEPTLTLGTIIKDDQEKYWLCIQPRCDSVRINDERKFLFLALNIIEGEKISIW